MSNRSCRLYRNHRSNRLTGDTNLNTLTYVTQLRIDALQNRNKLLDAAEAVFLDDGVDASLELVVARAGVGRATLFRNFADRNALIFGLLDRTLCEFEDEAARIGADKFSLHRLLRFTADRMIYRAPIIEYWRSMDQRTPVFIEARERLAALYEPALHVAIAQGGCREDLRPSDLPLLVTMLGGGLYAPTTELRIELAERAWMFVADMARLAPLPDRVPAE